MAGYIGTKAVALSTTTGTILGDMTVGGTTDVATLEFNSLSGTGAVTITDILDEDNLASNSATKLATQQSIKAYVDAQVDTVDTLAEILAIGNRTSGTGKIEFRDAAIFINSSTDGQLDIDADTELELTAPTIQLVASTKVDLDGNLDVSGTALISGDLTNGPLVTDVSTGKVFVGTDTARSVFYNGTFGGQLQIEGLATTSNYLGLTIVGNANNTNGGFLALGKTRGTAVNATTVVQAGDALGGLSFQGSDGTQMVNGADVFAEVLSGVGADDMPVKLLFRTNSGGTSPVERMKIQHTSGNNVVIADGLTLTDGDLKIGGTGHGIDFSAQNQSGSTTTSEVLDHYEEGTWTPAVCDIGGNNATMGSVRGKYIRIGTLVIANYGFNITSKGSMTGNFVFVKGIPFNHSGSNAGTGTLNRFSGLSGAVSGLSMEIGGNITNVAWFTDLPGTGATADGYLSPSQISNSFFAQGTLIYSIV